MLSPTRPATARIRFSLPFRVLIGELISTGTSMFASTTAKFIRSARSRPRPSWQQLITTSASRNPTWPVLDHGRPSVHKTKGEGRGNAESHEEMEPPDFESGITAERRWYAQDQVSSLAPASSSYADLHPWARLARPACGLYRL